jgi:hypothetical protein
MIAIAVQTIVSMILCFAIGFVTAWIIRGAREQREFQEFFTSWRSRYDLLERDFDGYMSRVTALQKELNAANARVTGQPDASPTEALVATAPAEDQTAMETQQASDEVNGR